MGHCPILRELKPRGESGGVFILLCSIATKLTRLKLWFHCCTMGWLLPWTQCLPSWLPSHSSTLFETTQSRQPPSQPNRLLLGRAVPPPRGGAIAPPFGTALQLKCKQLQAFFDFFATSERSSRPKPPTIRTRMTIRSKALILERRMFRFAMTPKIRATIEPAVSIQPSQFFAL